MLQFLLRRRKRLFQLCRNKRDAWFTFLGFLFFLGASYIALLAVSFADRKNPNSSLPIGNKTTLFDPVLDGFAEIRREIKQNPRLGILDQWFPWDTLADDLINYAIVLMLIRAFSLGKNALTVVRRSFIIIGTLYLLRSPFLILTILPTPWQICVSNPVEPLWLDAFLLLIKKRTACGDVFWSGHSIIYTSCLMLWNSDSCRLFLYPDYIPFHRNAKAEDESFEMAQVRRHSSNSALLLTDTSNSDTESLVSPVPRMISKREQLIVTFSNSVYWILRAVSIIIWFEGCLALIYGTLHYTIDVMTGVLFTTSVWSFYNLILRIPDVESHFFLGRVVGYIERL